MTEQKKTGQFKLVGGSIVILPPEDDDVVVEKQPDTVLEVSKGVITVKVEGDVDPSQVTSAETEALSSSSAKEVKADNQKLAEAAQIDVKARKAGNSVVSTGTFNDIDLPEYDKTTKVVEKSVDKKLEEDKAAQKAAEAKQASAEEEFNSALHDALEEQSEDYVEIYDED